MKTKDVVLTAEQYAAFEANPTAVTCSAFESLGEQLLYHSVIWSLFLNGWGINWKEA